MAAQEPPPTAPTSGPAAAAPSAQASGSAPKDLSSEAGTLHSAAEVRHFGSAQTGVIRPIRLHGVVTFVHAERATFFLSDPTGGVTVALADERLVLPSVGESVALTGFTEPGPRFPLVRVNSITRTGAPGLPPAREVSFESATTGAEEAQWVEISGQLSQTREVDGWLNLTLDTPAGVFSVSIPTSGHLSAPIGSVLRVRGVCNVWVTADRKKIGGFFLFTPALTHVQVVATSAADRTTLIQVGQVQKLRTDEAASGRPVRLRGVVTFTHSSERVFCLNDSTGGVRVWLEKNDVALPDVGRAVVVRGITSTGPVSTSVRADEIQIAGSQPLPVPRIVSLEQALTGAEDNQWVEMRGRLRQVESVGNWVRLTLTAAVGDFTVSIPHAGTLDAKVGSFLAVRGVCQVWLDDKYKIGGAFLYVPSLDQIRVAEEALADPFAAPEESIGNLPLYRTQVLQQQQVRIRGVVLHHVPGRYVVVENASGVVRALSRDSSPLSPGDRVEVAGVPGRQGNRSVLRAAVYRRTDPGPAPAPRALEGDWKVNPALEGRLVTLVGRLVNVLRRPQDTHLMVQGGASVLEVVYPDALPAKVAANWEVGSTVEVTGLYDVEYDEEDRPERFSLQLRTPAGVVVRERPSWWTAGRALTGLGVIAGCLVLGLAWVAALHRQVREQTGVIRAQLEKEAHLEARHGEIIRNANDCIFSMDLAGRFTSFNPAGERITGFTSAALLQLSLRDLLVPEDAAVVADLLSLDRPSEPATPRHFEMRCRTRDGRLVWLETNARVIHQAGQPAGFLGIARDITERKQVEAQNRKLEELDRHIQNSESLARMAGAIAHHFNNQLHSVIMGLQMAMYELPRDASAAGSLALSLQAARKAAEMSKLMLTYLGQSPGERVPVDLSAACRQGLVRLQADGPKNVIVESSLASPGPVVNANPGQIGQILANLLTNAWEAGGDAGGTIHLVVTTVSAAAIPNTHRFPPDFQPHDSLAYACLAVEDKGCGIPEQNLDKICDPFFTTKFPGRGMGLAVGLGIARAHGGVLVVESQPGQGSVFRLFLPTLAEVGPRNPGSTAS